MDCCELALYNAKLAQSIALGAFATLIICLAIFRNYYIKMKGLTLELKKKNGHEQKQIEDLRKSLLAFGKDNEDLKKEVERLKTAKFKSS